MMIVVLCTIFCVDNYIITIEILIFDVCNVLHVRSIRAIPTYRVYRLYDNNAPLNRLAVV